MEQDRTKLGDTEAERVRSTYRAYDLAGREQLWDRTNRGFDRLKTDSEMAILQSLRTSMCSGRPTVALDAGCGSGDLQVLAGRSGVDLVWHGIDLLADRIEVAAQRAPEAEYHVASADALPFEDASFDVVTAITLFSSIPSAAMEAAAAREIGRVLRPGGWLVWYDLRYGNPSNHAVHGIGRGQLRRLFPGWPAELRSLTVAPPIARRLGRLTPVAYPILHAVPPLRSHLVGRLRCPV